MLCATRNFWSSNKYWARFLEIGLVTLRAKSHSESLMQISTFFCDSTCFVCLICPLSVFRRFIVCVRVSSPCNPLQAELLSISDRWCPNAPLGRYMYEHHMYMTIGER